MNSLTKTFSDTQNQKPITLPNKSTATVLTKQEIESLRQDLRDSIARGHKLTSLMQKKFEI